LTTTSLRIDDLQALAAAPDVFHLFSRLGYDAGDAQPFEGAALDEFGFDEADRRVVKRAYLVGERDNHSVYLFEVDDLSVIRLRGLAWNVLRRGSALLVVTRDYRDILFVDPRFAGNPTKSNVRVNKLKVVTRDATRHDLDTLNAIHAHRRSGDQIYAAQRDAFNVTTVTKRFYDEYRRFYERTIAAVKEHNKGVHEFYDANKLHAFTQRLLGRLMFLYFLQRKGWLGGRGKFLTEMYRLTMSRHAGELGDGETFTYYREVLEPLFFDTLNQQRPGSITQWEGVRIPYLNGGLFDRGRDPQGVIILPDALFDPNQSDGLLNFFNRYNFTIADDTPLEQDVAVDPEMLGKVFENMLEERDRGQSGSFYTPRAIVAYMCQESLAGHLEERAAIPRETTRSLFDPDANAVLTADEAIRVNAALDTLTVLDPAVGSGSFLIGMMTEIIRLRRAAYGALNQPTEFSLTPRPPLPKAGEGEKSIPASVIAEWKARIIRDTLYGVDIKPEAVEIAQLRLWLALVVDQTWEDAHPLPNLDYKLMAGNSLIETIDGEPVLGASADAMLKGDFSRAGSAVMPVQTHMFNPVQLSFDVSDAQQEVKQERAKLDKLRREYFDATPERRKGLREEITAQERQIMFASLREKADKLQAQIDHWGKQSGTRPLKPAETKKLNEAVSKLTRITRMQEELSKPEAALPFFLYRLHFSEVFQRGGFDVVVANPPYVRGELIGDQKTELKITPIYNEVYAGSADLYVYFFARAYDLLRQGGQLAFITSNKYLRANYGRGLRQFLSENVQMRAIIDFGDLPVFDAAAYPCIVIGTKPALTLNPFPKGEGLAPAADFHPSPTGEGQGVRAVAVKDMDGLENLNGALQHGVRLQKADLGASEWQIANAAVQSVFAKLKAAGKPLGEYVNGKIYYGIKTGFNEAFVIDEAKRAELIAADAKSNEIIKPYLRGRDVKRWIVVNPNLYIIFTRRGIDLENYPAIKAHLEQYKQSLSKKAGYGLWYELQSSIAYYPELERPKIIYQEIATYRYFSFTTKPYHMNNKCFFIPTDDMYLLGLLNSPISWFYLGQIVSKLQGGAYSLQTIYMTQFPVPNALLGLREKIAAKARACLDAAALTPNPSPKGEGSKRLAKLEGELNALVYQAYGLTDEEIAVIEGAVGGSP